MGLAQGTALRERIAAARAMLRQLEAFRLRQPWWLPYPLFRRLAERKARRTLEPALHRGAANSHQRLDGIAEGAGVSLDAIYLANALEGVMSSGGESTVTPPTVTPPLGGCSAAAVGPDRSADGQPIVAHNFDYLPLLQPFYTLRRSCPADGLQSLDFTVAPLCGTVDGINEAGLAIAYDYAYAADADAGGPAPTISMAVAAALAGCRSVTEAAESIASRARWGAGLLMLADAEGDIASLELSHARSHLRRAEPGTGALFHSNAYFDDTMQEVEVSAQAVYDQRAPEALRGVRVLEASEVRDRRLAELLTAPPARDTRLGPDELAAVMADHGAQHQPGPNTICMHGDYWQTTACVQLLPARRAIRVAYDSACGAEYVEVACTED